MWVFIVIGPKIYEWMTSSKLDEFQDLENDFRTNYPLVQALQVSKCTFSKCEINPVLLILSILFSFI